MLRPSVRGPGALALALGLTFLVTRGGQAENNGPTVVEPVRIGRISTLFRDTPEGVALAMMQPFGSMMQSQTGVAGQLEPGGNVETLGEKLATDKVKLGVFHGIEFAWARLK